ncbi:MAG: hypothetical protein CM1200mP38_2720 [Dehalococcoidia bacterium]|nr:MAG: hypothetical protein CM1200mP38_2720 [Dehalococcoidia bacterium]
MIGSDFLTIKSSFSEITGNFESDSSDESSSEGVKILNRGIFLFFQKRGKGNFCCQIHLQLYLKWLHHISSGI